MYNDMYTYRRNGNRRSLFDINLIADPYKLSKSVERRRSLRRQLPRTQTSRGAKTGDWNRFNFSKFAFSTLR